MNKRTYTKITFFLIAVLLSIVIFSLFFVFLDMRSGKVNESDQNQSKSGTYSRGMYSWEEEPYLGEKRPDFYRTLEALKIDRVFQWFSDENLYSKETETFFKDIENMKMELYYLTGEPTWGLELGGDSMIAEINKVSLLNRSLQGIAGFEGIVLDVEPYLLEEWDEDMDLVMEGYISGMEKAYEYAKSKDLKVIICIPNWFDKDHDDALKTLIADCCDEVAVMNYTRSSELEAISREMKLAERYNKEIDCIFEFQKPGKHELTENETYFNEGLEAARLNFEKLYKYFKYDRLSFSYHYYMPVHEMLIGS